MIVATSVAGFIGFNLVRRLDAAGAHDMPVVDDLTEGLAMFRNLADGEALQ